MSLHQLIDALLSEPHETSTWTTMIERLVNQLLRERRIARKQPGTALSGIYLVLYNALKDELYDRVQATALSESHPAKLNASQLRAILSQASQTVVTYERLNQLALELQQRPPRSSSWQYANNELFSAVLLSDKLRRPSWMNQTTGVLYEDVRNDALEYAVKNIDRFDPEKAHFAGWINKICLERHGRNRVLKDQDTLIRGYLVRIKSTKAILSSVIRTRDPKPTQYYLKYHIRAINESWTNSDYLMISIALLSLKRLMEVDHKRVTNLLYAIAKEATERSVALQSLDVPIEHQDGNSQASEIRVQSGYPASPPVSDFLLQCLTSCAEENCQSVLEEHVKGHPQATFRAIAIQRVQEKKWRDISDSLGIPVPTLSAHYGRRIEKVKGCLENCFDDQLELWKMQNAT